MSNCVEDRRQKSEDSILESASAIGEIQNLSLQLCSGQDSSEAKNTNLAIFLAFSDNPDNNITRVSGIDNFDINGKNW